MCSFMGTPSHSNPGGDLCIPALRVSHGLIFLPHRLLCNTRLAVFFCRGLAFMCHYSFPSGGGFQGGDCCCTICITCLRYDIFPFYHKGSDKTFVVSLYGTID